VFQAFIGLLRWFWSFVDQARRATVNVLFLLLVLFLFVGSSSSGGPGIRSGSALVLDPEGFIVEQYAGEPMDRAMDRAFDRGRPEVLLRDIVAAIDRAATDDRISSLVLDLDAMAPTGLSKIQEIARAIDRFRDQGKPVIAAGDFYGQGAYMLASRADQVFLHPQGAVFIAGFGRYPSYFREALETLRINWNVFRVGEYKSVAEPYLRDDMSPEDREASQAILSDLWATYVDDVESMRGLDQGTIQDYADRFADHVTDAEGDLAVAAQRAGFVDELLHHHEMADRISEYTGRDGSGGFIAVGLSSYLQEMHSASALSSGGDAIAVIVAAGTILPGEQPPGTVGSQTLRGLIQQAEEDDSIAAVVLRIDSPGGSAFASDLIIRDLDQLRASGKPVVVSMSSVAASGGYWIALGGDEIFAEPSTITGSIGIVTMFPTFEGAMDWLGIHSDGVGTTELSGAFRSSQDLSPELSRIFQQSTESGYLRFITLVAERRGMEIDAVDRIARGRVWSGEAAEQLSLVDRLGGLEDAIESAAARADIEDYRVTYLEPQLTPGQRLLVDLLEASAPLGIGRSSTMSQLESLIAPVLVQVNLLAQFRDPTHRYAYCFCDGL
jgi:protease IV